ncbi:MAG: xylulokinase [Gammaproteobacteria bacterium]
MNETYLLGIDIGTSACKAILIDAGGAVVGATVREYPLHTPRAGWAEQNPEDWWQAVCMGVGALLRDTGISTAAIRGIGLSGQMHGLTPLDEHGMVLRPAILWNDQRTGAQCAWATQRAGGLTELLKFTNNPMLTGYTGGKILWLRDEEPALYARLRHAINPKDYIRYRLTGVIASEVSDASGTGLFDVRARRWSKALLKRLDIPMDILPPVYESAVISGALSEVAAAATGLPAGLAVAGGGGDAVVQTTGMGLITPGVLGITIGTAGILAMGLDRFYQNREGRLQIFCNNSPDTWHVMGVNLVGGGALRWLRDHLSEAQRNEAEARGVDAYTHLSEIAAHAPPGARGLLFLPYMIGERCPYPDPAARGGFIGLALHHGRADLTRAVLEGVVYNLRDIFELIRPMGISAQEIRSSGGGSVSPLWRQIQADVFQCPVTTVTGSAVGGAYGAALVAGVGVGVWADLRDAVGVLKKESETLPNPANRAVYEDLYGVYKSLYASLKPSFDALAEIQGRFA